MTTASKRTTSDTIRSAQEFALSSDKSQAMAKATEAWLTATAECQREMMSFMSMRLEKDGETTREMMACRNLADWTSIHSRWIQETLRDYSAETTKLMTICTKSVNSAGPTRG
ncbi:phasin family protein [Microvirga terrestris]|uniref:Phasin family protein n=1 Tax=Microvirga terrestris TaxID=2791024 RepID=A0ABS0HTU8_9HYPH|nr:phasin family protein [Microvirga terrestris]MBF9196932.1 phasin family protein [Microvirga terrestris]